MENRTKIVFGFLIVIIIGFCLIYTNKTKEGFGDPSPSPGTSPSPSPSTSPSPSASPNMFSSNEIQTIDKTINNLGVFANGLSTIDPETIKPEQLQDLQSSLLKEIKTLSSSLGLINDQMKLQQSQALLAQPVPENRLDMETSQKIQSKEIDQLTERLSMLKNMYNSYLHEKKIEEQPKIPIYSSCIMSEASGGYSVDNINKNKSSTSFANNEKPIVYANQSVVPSVQTYNHTRDLDINSNSFSLDDIINQLTQSAINVNFNV
jgi:hypothetical protein